MDEEVSRRLSRPFAWTGGAAALLAVALAFPFIGRAVNTSDGAEVVSETLGLFVEGRFTYAKLSSGQPASEHSMYGLFPSLLPLPFLTAGWPFRGSIGAPALDALVSLTWLTGTLLAALGFLRLARTLRPGASPLLAGGFVAGTFLWPYAADSFVEPWAAGCLAFAAADLLAPRAPENGRFFRAAVVWSLGALLKPVLWLTAPAFFLAAVLACRRAGRGAGGAGAAAAGFLPALVSAGLANWVRFGSPLETGYGDYATQFGTPLLGGLGGLLASPGRSLFLFAPIAALALLAVRRLSPAAIVLFVVVPALHILAIARWFSWPGGASWGPRLLLPILPLLAAPAILLSARATVVALALGALVNLSGVLVAPGAWIGYVERLPAAAPDWPEKGSERVSVVPQLSPVRGHAILFLRALGVRTAFPYPGLGPAGQSSAAESVSPWIVRRLLGLPPISPILPRLLVRVAAAHVARGDMPSACRYAREAHALAPGDLDASRLLVTCAPMVSR
jgi:hypothetical protein